MRMAVLLVVRLQRGNRGARGLGNGRLGRRRLGRRITVDELSRTDPMLGALITNAVASNGNYLDATLYLDAR